MYRKQTHELLYLKICLVSGLSTREETWKGNEEKICTLISFSFECESI
jgi:hypothetical protein